MRLVVDADNLETRVVAECVQQRRPVMAWHAPRRPDIHDADLPRTSPASGREWACPCRSGRGVRAASLRAPAVDQHRGNLRRIAGSQPQKEQRRQTAEDDERDRRGPAAAAGSRPGHVRIALRGHDGPDAGRAERRVTPLTSRSRRMARWRRWSAITQPISTTTTRGRCIGGGREVRVLAEVHVRRLKPARPTPAAGAACERAGAGSRCAWPPDAASGTATRRRSP